MVRIVTKPMIMDLHIHSEFSRHKDTSDILNNSVKNLDTLVNKLNFNKVNICAITDHDVFSFSLYNKLKSEEGIGTIKKVLPGIEFSVMFEQKKFADNSVHVVAIFDDTDEEKLKNIENIIQTKDEDSKLIVPKYDLEGNFSEKKFIEILREIDLNVVLIAHQKSSPTGSKHSKNDLLSLNERSNELLFTGYFDALEFRNRNNEVFNKAFVKDNELNDKIGFITGSDCHYWEDYPYMFKGDSKTKLSKDPHIFTYAKCLPTFEGLKMCFTDHSRFKFENKFFNTSNNYIDNIELSIDETLYDIPLSKGINVIIGDNSIGKSFFLYELLGDSRKKELKPAHRKGYEKYAKKHKINFETNIDSSKVFVFDSQGKIRNKFENNKFKDDSFLSSFFENKVDTSTYLTVLTDELRRLEETIDKSDKNHKLYNSLPTINFTISTEGNSSFNITSLPEKRLSKKEEYKNNVDWLIKVITTIENQEKIKLTQDELKYINDTILVYFKELKENYNNLYKLEVKKDDIYNCVQQTFNNIRKEIDRSGTEFQSVLNTINNNIDATKDIIINLVKYKKESLLYKMEIDEHKWNPNVNRNKNYNFVTTTNITEINSEYFIKIFNGVFKNNQIINPVNTTYDEITNNVAYLPENTTGITHLKNKMLEKFNADLNDKYIINKIEEDQDIHQELSAGMNQRSYFDIISGEERRGGIYIVDQPEDGVAQRAINEYVLNDFKELAENRQIIMVTHNPQFIVNLDVDNVIYIEKDENNEEISIKYGALEYYNDEYSILEIVSENIEGGIDALRKRWNRYGKNY